MLLDNVLTNSETKPQSSFRRPLSFRSTVKWLENARLLICSNTRPSITYLKNGYIVALIDLYLHGKICGRIFQGIADDIGHDLAHAMMIKAQDHRLWGKLQFNETTRKKPLFLDDLPA